MYVSYETGRPRIVAGLMSGTSVDAIDVALISITDEQNRVEIDILGYEEFPWKATERDAILSASTLPTTSQQFALIDRMIGERFCDVLNVVTNRLAVSLDAIGFHGQTVAHVPRPDNDWLPSTLQLGNPHACAHCFDCPVVFDFRRSDMVAGGQGAPLVPAADSLIFQHLTNSGPIVVQNIGGIGNVTYLESGRPPIGFDTGPGNMVLDQVMAVRSGSRFDINGLTAKSGVVNQALLLQLESLFRPSKPPISYGREQFGASFVNNVLTLATDIPTNNLMATLSEWTASTIAKGLEFLPKRPSVIYVSGGGAHNADLINRVERLCGCPVSKLDELGISSDAREAVAFAVLADARLRGIKFNLAQVTGSQVLQGLGSIALP